METKENGQSVAALNGVTIKMFETHRRRPDTSELYHAEKPGSGTEPEEANGDDQEEDGPEEPEIERVGGNGEVFLLRPKREPKSRNAPGSAVAAAKGGN